jgi:nicotinamide-nucleotide amidase
MAVTAQIITIGDEILYGQTLDTNSHWISGVLDEINIKVLEKITIGDERDQIMTTFKEAQRKADVVLITGGLGPTNDDLTKPLLAEFFGTELELHQEALEDIERLFAKAGRRMTELNRKQAELPKNCTKITNPLGTAPGMWFQENNTIFVSMPGVPYEMKRMMKETILPKLQQKLGKGVIFHKLIKTIGIPESKLADKLESWEGQLPAGIKLAYLPSLGQVKLRLTATGDSLDEVKSAVQEQINKLPDGVSKYIYGYDEDEIEKVVGDMLRKNAHSISTAESCTVGYLAHMITSIAGSSDYFKGSVISYANEIKSEQLDIDPEIIEKHGAVSEEVVKLMAENVRKKLKTDVGLATSGVAGPGGGSEEKPVGTVWLAYADGNQTVAKKMQFTKDRMLNIQFSALAALNLFRLNYSGN